MHQRVQVRGSIYGARGAVDGVALVVGQEEFRHSQSSVRGARIAATMVPLALGPFLCRQSPEGWSCMIFR
jgi:hypothetical protein